MSIQRYLGRKIGIFLLISFLLCSVLSIGTVYFLIEKNRIKLQEKQLDGALEQVQNTILESGSILRDIANDPSLHYFIQQADSIKSGDGLTKLCNHLLYILFTQNDFRGLMLQVDDLVVAHFGTRVAAVTSHYGSTEMNGSVAENMRRLAHDNNISEQCVFSVRTNEGFVISGLVDLEGSLGDTLGDCVVYDDERRLLYNGLVDRCSDSVILKFLSSNDDEFILNGENMHVARKSSSDICVAMFEKKEPIFLDQRNVVSIFAVIIVVGTVCALMLHSADNQFKRLIVQIKENIPNETSQAEWKEPSRKLRIQRRNRSMQTWLWTYLVRICVLPIVIFVFACGWICIMNLITQNEKYTASIVEQQLSFANLHYKKCDSFLRNTTFDYLLQQYMSGKRSAWDDSFFERYSAVLWNKCSESSSLKSIAICDSDWNRVYLTGSVDIDVDRSIMEHFENTFSVYVNDEGDNVVCCLGIRDACIGKNDTSTLYKCYGYVIILLDDPVSWLESRFDDPRVIVRTLDSDIESTDLPVGYIRVYSHMPMLDCQLEVITPVLGDFQAEISRIVLSFAVLLTGIFSILVLTANRLSSWMLNMLVQLQDAMEGVFRGDKSDVAKTGVLEIDFVVECFQSMTVALQKKQDELNRKQIELLNEQKRRVDLQLAAIESQLSPHFLFNIFTSIRFLLEEGNVADAKQMLKFTAKLFRSTLYRGNTLTRLDAEIEHVRSYMEIQCFRYKNKLALSIEPFSMKILDALLPQYTLQPLVENAIEHALPGRDHLHVSLRAWYCNGEVWIEISDDGGNVTAESISRIHELLETDDPSIHCGLSNINKRLKLHFGEHYGLSFAVSNENGLSVVVYIPYRCNASDFE